MSNKYSPGCGCCGDTCAIAEISSEIAPASSGFVNQDALTPAVDGDGYATIASAEHIQTTATIDGPGYSLTAYYDLELGTPSFGVSTITAGDPEDYDGMRIEVIDGSENILAYVETPTIKTVDMDGATYTAPAIWATFGLQTDPDPYVIDAYDNKVEVCISDQTIQFTTWLRHGVVFAPVHNLLSAADDSYRNNNTSPVSYGWCLSVPFTHDYAVDGPVRLRLKNNGSVTQTYRRVVAVKNYSIDNGTLTAGGCDGDDAVTSNPTCDDCSRVCAALPDNQNHKIEVVTDPFTPSLDTGIVIAHNNCNSEVYSDFGEGFAKMFGRYNADPNQLTDYTMSGTLTYTFESTAVVDPFTSEVISGYFIATQSGVSITQSSVTELPYKLTATYSSTDGCEVTYFVTLKLYRTAGPSLVASATPSSFVADYVHSPASETSSGPKFYADPDGPPPTLTGTVTTPIIWRNYSRGGSSYTFDEVTEFNWTVTVPRWRKPSANISLPLVNDDDDGPILLIPDDVEVTGVYATGTFPNGGENTRLTHLRYTHNVTKLDLTGLNLVVRLN